MREYCEKNFPRWSIVMAASGLPSVNHSKSGGICRLNRGVQAALDHKLTDLIVEGDSSIAIEQAIVVIACKHSALQVKLARHRELVERFISVDTCTLSAVTIQQPTLWPMKKWNPMIKFSLRRRTYEELRNLNWIQKKLVADNVLVRACEALPAVSPTTRSTIRGVRYADQQINGRPT